MPDKPAAETFIDASLVRLLLASQATDVIPDAAVLPLAKVAEGWDNEVWRLGDSYAVRLPRRALAAPLVLNEQRVMAAIAARLAPTGVRVPAPLVAGAPSDGYPWAWSVVPWIDGERALDEMPAARGAWAGQLARVLGALHADAPDDHPINPLRGNPLATRADSVDERMQSLHDARVLDAGSATALHAAWHAGLAAAPWDRPPVWIHGDLHPGNLVTRDGVLAGIIDFGDVTAGDPAYDLAVAWLAFDAAGRQRFTAAAGSRYDDDTWVRSRAWAAAVALMLLARSDDNPAYVALGRHAADEVISRPPGGEPRNHLA